MCIYYLLLNYGRQKETIGEFCPLEVINGRDINTCDSPMTFDMLDTISRDDGIEEFIMVPFPPSRIELRSLSYAQQVAAPETSAQR